MVESQPFVNQLGFHLHSKNCCSGASKFHFRVNEATLLNTFAKITEASSMYSKKRARPRDSGVRPGVPPCCTDTGVKRMRRRSNGSRYLSCCIRCAFRAPSPSNDWLVLVDRLAVRFYFGQSRSLRVTRNQQHG